MPNLQNKQPLRRPIQLIDNPIVADAVFEAARPRVSLKRPVTQQFCIFTHPTQLVQNPCLKTRTEMFYIRLRLRHQNNFERHSSPDLFSKGIQINTLSQTGLIQRAFQ